MPKSGYVMSEKESAMVVRTLDVVQKRLEKLKGKFQGSRETQIPISRDRARRKSKTRRS